MFGRSRSGCQLGAICTARRSSSGVRWPLATRAHQARNSALRSAGSRSGPVTGSRPSELPLFLVDELDDESIVGSRFHGRSRWKGKGSRRRRRPEFGRVCSAGCGSGFATAASRFGWGFGIPNPGPQERDSGGRTPHPRWVNAVPRRFPLSRRWPRGAARPRRLPAGLRRRARRCRCAGWCAAESRRRSARRRW